MEVQRNLLKEQRKREGRVCGGRALGRKRGADPVGQATYFQAVSTELWRLRGHRMEPDW